MSYATALNPATNGELNKLFPRDRAVHEWYRFVLSFPPHLAREYIGRFRLRSTARILDPFCGTGTTLVECKKLGLPSVGVEAHPMAHFAAAVKTDWRPDPEGLLQHARGIAVTATAQLVATRIADEQALAIVSDNKQAELRTLSPEKQALLLSGCISPLPLHKTLVLLDSINARRDDRYYRHELLALAKALVYSISNLHFGPEVGVGAIKMDAAVIATWLTGVASTSFQRTIIVEFLPTMSALTT